MECSPSPFKLPVEHWQSASWIAALKRSNESMAVPPVVFNFIGVVFTAILYGKYCTIVSVQDDKCTQCYRCLLPDIRLILANQTQEIRSMERRTPLSARC